MHAALKDSKAGKSFALQGNGVVAELPALGTALPIIITMPAPAEGPPKGSLALPAVGSWVKLRNVKSWVIAGQLQVCSVAAKFGCHLLVTISVCTTTCFAPWRC